MASDMQESSCTDGRANGDVHLHLRISMYFPALYFHQATIIIFVRGDAAECDHLCLADQMINQLEENMLYSERRNERRYPKIR
jgi:hypothetical protein